MKFTNGYWMIRDGVDALYAREAYELAADATTESLNVLAPTSVVRGRYDTLNLPTFNVDITTPAEGVIRVCAEHWQGATEYPGFPLNADEAGNGKITLPVHLKLYAVEYTLAVWTDYVVAGTTTDLYYNTENLQQVTCTTPYTGSTGYRDCLYGTTALDLRQYRDEWNAKVQIKVDMVRPLAKYELIATDVKDFLRKTKKQRADDAAFTITFSYGFYLPTVFNVLAGKPADSRTGVAYTIPLAVPDDGTEECRIGTDFVFVNGAESFVKLSMEIQDGDGNVISRTTGLEVPYRRGHLTTVRARFLTNEMQGGVDIDPDFDGDIDIDLDGLLH